MDNFLISSLIYDHCPKLAHRFVGCFPCNTFPPLHSDDGRSFNRFQIVNTEPQNAGGSHWILIGRRDRQDRHVLFYFDSLDATTMTTTPPTLKNIPYECIRNRLLAIYTPRNNPYSLDIQIIRPQTAGIVPQNIKTSTCGLYCIYMAHMMYSDIEMLHTTEDDVLQFAHEHFGKKFVKQVFYL